jgi:hypothetical protein
MDWISSTYSFVRHVLTEFNKHSGGVSSYLRKVRRQDEFHRYQVEGLKEHPVSGLMISSRLRCHVPLME